MARASPPTGWRRANWQRLKRPKILAPRRSVPAKLGASSAGAASVEDVGGTQEARAGEVGAVEARADDDDAVEPGAAEVGASTGRHGEVGSEEIAAGERGAFEVEPAQVELAQVQAAEIQRMRAVGVIERCVRSRTVMSAAKAAARQSGPSHAEQRCSSDLCLRMSQSRLHGGRCANGRTASRTLAGETHLSAGRYRRNGIRGARCLPLAGDAEIDEARPAFPGSRRPDRQCR